ncbi:MAG: DNA-3-methyladenine glycosylase [Candidatus Dormibacteria bacterium]
MTRALLTDAADAVAARLVGAVLEVDAGTPLAVRARIVEVEAYLGAEDAASHAARGPTPRSEVMFAEPGHLYVYLSYGVHHCANVVCSPPGVASAVLLRAAEVLDGAAVVEARRPATAPARLLSGPGNLCKGLHLGLADNREDLCGEGRLRIYERESEPVLARGPRIGISRATEAPLRLWDAASTAVSVRRGPTQKRTGTSAGPRNVPNLVRRPGV